MTNKDFLLTQKLFRRSRGLSLLGEFKGNIRQKYCNKSEGEGDYCSCIGIPKIKRHSDLSSKIVITKQSVPNSISAVKTRKFTGEDIPTKLGPMKAAPYHPAERLIDNPDKDLTIAFLSFLVENIIINHNLSMANLIVK